MTLESSKTLGGIGALLMFIGVFPYINYFGVLEIIGVILVLFALHGLSDYYKEKGIFNHALYGALTVLVGGILAGALVVITVLTSLTDLLKQVYPGWNGNWSTLQGMTPDTSNLNLSTLGPLIAGIVAFLVLIWFVAIIASLFIWRSLKQVSNKSGTGLFGTTGLILLIGAIIPIVGLILMWVAALLLAIAFFTLKPSEQSIATTYSSPPPPTI